MTRSGYLLPGYRERFVCDQAADAPPSPRICVFCVTILHGCLDGLVWVCAKVMCWGVRRTGLVVARECALGRVGVRHSSGFAVGVSLGGTLRIANRLLSREGGGDGHFGNDSQRIFRSILGPYLAVDVHWSDGVCTGVTYCKYMGRGLISSPQRCPLCAG